jgi:hypothetical protein
MSAGMYLCVNRSTGPVGDAYTRVAERFEFITAPGGPGLHQSMADGLLCQLAWKKQCSAIHYDEMRPILEVMRLSRDNAGAPSLKK